MSEHAKLSPSNHRWPHCPGSIREEAAYPDIPGEAAIDGTGTHLLLEMMLLNPTVNYLAQLIGVNHHDKPKGWMINQDRIDRVNIVLSYIERRKRELKEEYADSEIRVKTESKSKVGDFYYRDDWWGTVDVTILVYQETLGRVFTEIVDLKDGRTYVSEKDNSQLIAYAGGTPSWKNRMTIVQPKTNPPIRYVDIEYDALRAKLDELAAAAKLTEDPEAPLVSGAHCKWCKHHDKCKARTDEIIGGLNMIKEDSKLFEIISETFNDIENMDADTLSQLLDMKAPMDDIFKRAQEQAQKNIESGIHVPGYAMLPGNSKNQWSIDEELLVAKLKAVKFKKDEIYIPKLISAAQLLKHPKLTSKQKERLERECIKNVPGNKTLKPVSKQQQETNVIDEFKDIALQCNTVSFI